MRHIAYLSLKAVSAFPNSPAASHRKSQWSVSPDGAFESTRSASRRPLDVWEVALPHTRPRVSGSG